MLLSTVAGASYWAATPSRAGAADLEELFRAFAPSPEPVLFPRKAVDMKFAVLLMRSSYDAVDKLDFIPMEDFQIAFWKLRQSEQTSFSNQHAPLKARVGDLTDPLYLDFISFSQYAAISAEMGRPQKVFKELYVDPETLLTSGEPRVIRRDPAITDAMLPDAFFHTTGDLIYKGLSGGFEGKDFGAPAPLPAGASLKEVVAGVSQLLSVMCTAGYALKVEVSASAPPSPTTTGFTVKLAGPLNLWGLEALQYRRAVVEPVYDAMAVASFLRASGRRASYQLSVTDVGVEEQWTLEA